jgi:hypothetical protein
MQYLADRYDTEYKISFPRGTREWYEVNNWLFFMNAGVGPMQGQASMSLRCSFEQARKILSGKGVYTVLSRPRCVGSYLRVTARSAVLTMDGKEMSHLPVSPRSKSHAVSREADAPAHRPLHSLRP